jgi:predicted MFS family arabinose efflux permease
VQTMVGDAIPYERRGRAMGIVMASFSLATVAGVPASLWLAQVLGWHASFIAIALASLVIGAIGLRTLPRLEGHLHAARATSAWRSIAAVLREPNHWHVFGFSALVMATSFTVIPFITIYLTANVGVEPAQVPLIYLAGGVATLFTSRGIGVLADRWGKVPTFRLVAALAVLPVLGLTYLGPTPIAVVLVVTTLFFVLVSGRMVPGMALITSAMAPSLRGTFMSLNGSVQSAAMGLASMLGGVLIGRDAGGMVQGYERCGWVAVLLTLLALWWVGRLRLPAMAAAATPASPPLTVADTRPS